MCKPIIQFQDYRRIFNTIFSVLQNENASINHSCIYFSVIGSAILIQKYKLDPKIYMGVAAYMLDEKENNVLAFAEKDENCLVRSENGFHSWIVVNDWIIDFTAPLFPNMIKTMYENSMCESKMFQKPLSDMCASVDDLKFKGDFFLYEDIPFANEMMDGFLKSPLNVDLTEVCCQWYRRPPSKMKKFITLSNETGDIEKLSLKSHKILGAW